MRHREDSFNVNDPGGLPEQKLAGPQETLLIWKNESKAGFLCLQLAMMLLVTLGSFPFCQTNFPHIFNKIAFIGSHRLHILHECSNSPSSLDGSEKWTGQTRWEIVALKSHDRRVNGSSDDHLSSCLIWTCALSIWQRFPGHLHGPAFCRLHHRDSM